MLALKIQRENKITQEELERLFDKINKSLPFISFTKLTTNSSGNLTCDCCIDTVSKCYLVFDVNEGTVMLETNTQLYKAMDLFAKLLAEGLKGNILDMQTMQIVPTSSIKPDFSVFRATPEELEKETKSKKQIIITRAIKTLGCIVLGDR